MIRLWKAFLNTLSGLRWAVRHESSFREEWPGLRCACGERAAGPLSSSGPKDR